MSLLGRFLGGDRSNALAEGMALMEERRFAEAANRLRVAALGRSDSASGSLASYHFRQALVAEGRRLMRIGKSVEALEGLAEAVRLWDQYPDLHCLHGTALAQAGNWDLALQEARFALRLNHDYIEARLLEATALNSLKRHREAADSLNSLVESDRRVDHWLIDTFKRARQYGPQDLPPDMIDHLTKSLSGESEKEEVAAAVALCREGRWQEGLDCFSSLVLRRPRYPDYRTRHAAALFQMGQVQKALEEVEAALALNERYRTAIDLKGLILADCGRLLEARSFLQDADEQLEGDSNIGAHEELFGAYLRGVLALLTGYAVEVPKLLEGWPDLVRTFARAELLLAAADDLLGRTTTCGRRLADLADEWSAEPVYFELLAYHHLGNQRYRDVAGVISRWPSKDKESTVLSFLGEVLSLSEAKNSDDSWVAPDGVDGVISAEAWQFLAARACYQTGDDAGAWQLCESLLQRGIKSERLVRLQTAAAAGNPDHVVEQWSPPKIIPESCLPQHVYFEVRKGRPQKAVGFVQDVLQVHPDCLTARWLSPEF
jgi:tetratricopeptide (TPR) repeat protein